MLVLLNTSTNVPILLSTSAHGSLKILYRKQLVGFRMLLPKLMAPYYLVRFSCNGVFGQVDSRY